MADVNELIESTLTDLLMQQLREHVPSDERVGIDTGWIGYTAPGAIYPDVQHRLPQLTRPVGDGHLHATLGRHGGIRVRVTNRIGDDVLGIGTWIDGVFEQDQTPPDS